MILFTDERCQFDGKAYPGIPLILNNSGRVIEPVSDYLRAMVLRRDVAKSTAAEYAKKLRSWWTFLEEVGCDWKQVSDAHLLAFRNKMSVGGTSKGVINDYIGQIFAFYVWAQEEVLIEEIVRPVNPIPGRRYRISSTCRRNKRGSLRLRSTLLFRTVRKPFRHTPTDAEILRLHQAAGQFRHAFRNVLFMLWAEQVGLRRAEMLSLKLDVVPDFETIELNERNEQNFDVKVTGKGGKIRHVAVRPGLMLMTWDYVETERRAIALRRRQDGGHTDIKALFLSSRGAALTPGALSNFWTDLFRRAGVKNASGHRFRAVFLTRLFENYIGEQRLRPDQIDRGTVLLRVAEAAGHANPTSLEPYLNAVLKKRLVEGRSEQRRRIEQDIAVLECRREYLKATLSEMTRAPRSRDRSAKSRPRTQRATD